MEYKYRISTKEIRKINLSGDLAIFVGAGVSVGCGLPSWDTLISNLSSRIWRYKKPTPGKAVINFIASQTPTDIARFARNEVGNDLNRIVSEILYRENPIQISETILAIARSGVRHICTLNYDDLIEEGFGLEMNGFQSVVNGESFNIHNKCPIIYHPHGYLPRFASHHEYKNYQIVLSDDDYNALYSNPLSWANTVQTSLLVTKSALFIGHSMKDPNLKRLLSLTKAIGCTHQHYAILPAPHLTMDGLKLKSCNQIQETITIDMLARNVKVHWINSFDELPIYLNEVFM